MDKYHVYRPMLNLIGYTEGTDKGAGYNETLAYGAYTGGAVNLIGMTLDELDALQTKMLRHPKNRLKSSAAGRFQIVRTTARAIRAALDLTGSEKFNEDMQDRMACFLLGQRGIDKYLAGRMSEDTLINNLAKEWASLPTTAGKGHYGGQHAAVSPARVRAVLAEVRARHREDQPKEVETVEVEKPVVPEKVDKEVKQKTNWLTYIFGAGGLGSGAVAFLRDADWQTIAALMAGGVVAGGLSLAAGIWIVRRIKAIKAEIAA